MDQPSTTSPLTGSPPAAAEAPPLLGVEDVGMDFSGHRVLEHLGFGVPRGQTLTVIGESGCGKTVLLKLLIGLLRPTRGRVVFDGRVLADLPDKELNRQRVRFGFLFQGAALFDSLSVYDNVAFGLRGQRRLGEDQIRDKVRQRLQEVGLSPDVENKKPAELSGGMKKRVGLARALALDPEVMLYDEPTTGLDPIMSDVISDLIVQTRQRHPVTSIVVTHDMKIARKVADRVIMLYPLARLKPGERQVLFDGSSSELDASTEPRIVRFVRGEAEHE
jgi:phospholipid/cholesterol/gamma-HCH transport system ATP-binding protein